MDVIIPATTNTVFRTFPSGADAAPYGSHHVDLTTPEPVLWRRIQKITRQNIGTARSLGVEIRDDFDDTRHVYDLIRDTFRRSHLAFMDYDAFCRYLSGLKGNGRIITAHYQGTLQSCVVYGFSTYCAYAVYGGNRADMVQGAGKLLHWETMLYFKRLEVKRYDFCGARINPHKGSKQESINAFKHRLGGELVAGYIWKYPLRPVGALVYSYAIRLSRGGDIVDQERHKMTDIRLSTGKMPQGIADAKQLARAREQQ
jgi:lipid II:glycine glycyltransferase (peptidoglycan interpeptide bridge formation enzyme)